MNYAFVKKAIGITIASLALLALLPLFLVIILIIKLESKGPAMYTSLRVGQNYKIFGLIKFRTMTANADKQMDVMKKLNLYNSETPETENTSADCPFCKILGRPCSPILHMDGGEICENHFMVRKERGAAFYKIKNDPRVTRFGKFLRASNLDELPQLINVIKGEMSIIGNRPLPLYEAEKLTYDGAIERFNSPAGLTGLWQVTKRGRTEVTAAERIELDKEYARTWSAKTDIKILFRTFPALFRKENV